MDETSDVPCRNVRQHLIDNPQPQHVPQSPQQPPPHTPSAKRLQNIWSAVKKFSSKPSTTTSGAPKPFWSPFVQRKRNFPENSIYSSHPELHSEHRSFGRHSFGENVLPTSNKSSKWHSNAALIGSPLKRIRKITQDMQRCVHRSPSSDYQISSIDPPLNSEEIVVVCPENTVTLPASSGVSYEAHSSDKDVKSSDPARIIEAPNCHSQSLIGADVKQTATTTMRSSDVNVNTLQNPPFHQLDVHLKYAEDLLAKDSCGTSDPYVKFKLGNEIVHRSRTIFKTLNPTWDDYFMLPINDIQKPLILKVYDYDYFLHDDYLGSVVIDLTKLDVSRTVQLELFLQEDERWLTENVDQKLGKIFLTLKLIPKTLEDKETFYGKSMSVSVESAHLSTIKRGRTQQFESVVNILLIDGTNFELDCDYAVRFKLANEKFKSKVISKIVRQPNWTEQCDLNVFAAQSKMLEISVCGANQSINDHIFKTGIDLFELETNRTHRISKSFACENSPTINLLLTISGVCLSPLASKTLAEIHHELTQSRTFRDMSHIGNLVVKVHKADSLASADINGKSDPFCVLELLNQRVRTMTHYKSLSPEWGNIFAFKFDDIHSVLEVTVYDEDRDGAEFLGKIAIPLLEIKNEDKKWFALKDKKLRSRVKGHILLEFMISYDKLKASVRTFTPREKKVLDVEPKFKRTLFIRNTNRLKNIIVEILDIGRFLNSCIQWEYPLRSFVAFITFLWLAYFCELYMFPLFLMLFLLKNYCWRQIAQYFNPDLNKLDNFIDESSLEEFDEDKTEDKKSLKERLQTVQEISAVVMNVVGEIASFFERLKNTCNFSVPFLSWLAVICLFLITWLLYLIPLRYLLIAWGINKFTKKFRSPDAIDNNELLDFLSRIPDSEEKIMFKQFRPNICEQTVLGSSSTPSASTSARSTRPPLNKNASIQSDRSVNSDTFSTDNKIKQYKQK